MINHILFIFSQFPGHLGSFHLLALVNSAAMNICVQVCVWTPGFNSSGHIRKGGMYAIFTHLFFILQYISCKAKTFIEVALNMLAKLDIR